MDPQLYPEERKTTMKNSKRKGKVGELEVANYLKNKGLTARRGQQYQGSPDSPDVICDEWSQIHIEVKRNEHLNIEEALKQSSKDSGTNQIPIVIHRKNRENWKTTLWLDDFIDILSKTDI